MAVLRPHLALTVSDVDRSIPFYEALFGTKPEKIRDGYAKFSVARIPVYCPACGRRVVRERNPTVTSPVIAHWRAVADQLTPRAVPPPERGPEQPHP